MLQHQIHEEQWESEKDKMKNQINELSSQNLTLEMLLQESSDIGGDPNQNPNQRQKLKKKNPTRISPDLLPAPIFYQPTNIQER